MSEGPLIAGLLCGQLVCRFQNKIVIFVIDANGVIRTPKDVCGEANFSDQGFNSDNITFLQPTSFYFRKGSKNCKLYLEEIRYRKKRHYHWMAINPRG